MHVTYLHVSTLVPHYRNLRKNDSSVERLATSIQEYGFKIPILARSTGEIVDGHLRLKAAIKLGMTEVPVILCDEWTEAQVKAFRLMVNRSASWAEWDTELVALELGELQAINFDLALTGFDTAEIADFLFRGKEEGEEAPPPDPPSDPVSRFGDLWLCGNSRVLCGDATSKEAVKRVLADAIPTLMVTDPPYGVQYDPAWRERAGLGQARQSGLVANDHQADWTAAYKLFSGDVAYVWHAGVHAAEVARGLEKRADLQSAVRSFGPSNTSL